MVKQKGADFTREEGLGIGTLEVSKKLTVTGPVEINGNLTVTGFKTEILSTDKIIKDRLIELGNGTCNPR